VALLLVNGLKRSVFGRSGYRFVEENASTGDLEPLGVSTARVQETSTFQALVDSDPD
jgi:hypothetical protein